MTLHGEMGEREKLAEDWRDHLSNRGEDERIELEHVLTDDRPSPYRLAVIAALISGGKEPRMYLPAALELYCEALDFLEFYDNEFEFEHLRAALPDHFGPKIDFKRHDDWDDAREYLQNHGCHLKTAKAFLRNYRELCIRLREEKQSEEDAVQKYKIALKQDVISIPRRWLDELIKQKKAKKAMGGKKSQQTRKHARAPKRVK
jgi:hypothetical protein